MHHVEGIVCYRCVYYNYLIKTMLIVWLFSIVTVLVVFLLKLKVHLKIKRPNPNSVIVTFISGPKSNEKATVDSGHAKWPWTPGGPSEQSLGPDIY